MLEGFDKKIGSFVSGEWGRDRFVVDGQRDPANLIDVMSGSLNFSNGGARCVLQEVRSAVEASDHFDIVKAGRAGFGRSLINKMTRVENVRR